jgi:hypothetical protein
MRNLLSGLRKAAAKRAEYRRIRDEIRHMPVAMALDLDIYPGDADKIAYRAVYGA